MSFIAIAMTSISCGDREPIVNNREPQIPPIENPDKNKPTEDDTELLDKRYFVTEWQGAKISIFQVCGQNIVAQYRAKDIKTWTDVQLSDKSLTIDNLSSDKTYELRILNIDSIKVVDPSNAQARNNNLKKVTQWGTTEWKGMNCAFYNCVELNVVAKDTPNLKSCNSCNLMFGYCQHLDGNDVFNDWDVSSITNMRGMFCGAGWFDQPLNNWDVSKVINMREMFSYAYKFNQPISNWDVSNVTEWSNVFDNCIIGKNNKPQKFR